MTEKNAMARNTNHYAHHARMDIFVWIGLIAATFSSVWLGYRPTGISAGLVMPLIIIIAWFKIRLIIMYFMEIRTVPLPFKLLFEAWGIVVAAILIFLLL